MVALFVVLTVIVFLCLDLILAARNQAGLAGAVSRQREAEAQSVSFVGGFALAPDRSYHPAHTWAKFRANATARVGLDDFAARLVGAPDAIEFPEIGSTVRAGQPLAVVVRRGRRTTLVAPVTGIVTAVNHDVVARAATATREPFEDGWLVEVKGKDLRRDLKTLLHADRAHGWLDTSVAALHQVFAPAGAVAAAADGGRPMDAIADQLDDETWAKVSSQFLQA